MTIASPNTSPEIKQPWWGVKISNDTELEAGKKIGKLVVQNTRSGAFYRVNLLVYIGLKLFSQGYEWKGAKIAQELFKKNTPPPSESSEPIQSLHTVTAIPPDTSTQPTGQLPKNITPPTIVAQQDQPVVQNETQKEQQKPYTWEDSSRSLESVSMRLEPSLNPKTGLPEIASYVSFTNPAYDKTYKKGDGSATWKIHISIDPKQRDIAWPIVKKCLETSPLKIHGKIHQAKENSAVQPGKEIALLVNSSDEDPNAWTFFLSNLSKELSKASIRTDSRAINSDKEQAQRKWDAIIKVNPPTATKYFNYRTDLYTTINDDIWDDMTNGYAVDSHGTVASPPGVPHGEKMIKASYFKKLSENEKHNPANENDFLKDIFVKG